MADQRRFVRFIPGKGRGEGITSLNYSRSLHPHCDVCGAVLPHAAWRCSPCSHKFGVVCRICGGTSIGWYRLCKEHKPIFYPCKICGGPSAAYGTTFCNRCRPDSDKRKRHTPAALAKSRFLDRLSQLGLLAADNPCSECGVPASCWHHPDDLVPDQVVAVCGKCHDRLHRRMRAARALSLPSALADQPLLR